MYKLYFFIPIFSWLFTYGIKQANDFHQEKTLPKDSVVTVTISTVGDLMCHSVEYNYAKVSPDSFNFNPFFNYIKPYLSRSDFLFGNMETVLAGKKEGYSGYPLFNSPSDFLAPLKNVGFNLITTANNHALDKGSEGLLRTIRELKKYKLNYDGTFNSQHDRDSIRIFNIKGLRTALLAYTYGTNGNPIPKGKNYLINIIDTTLIKKDILSARKDCAEIVIVYFHFGHEYSRTPSDFQKTIVNKTIKYGADIIIGGHPHVIQPVEYFKTKHAKLDSGFVAYSVGNFLSNQRWRYSDAGVILTIHITKNFNTDSIYISKVSYIPTWVYKGKTKEGNKYMILSAQLTNADSSLTFLTKKDKFKMKQAFNDTKNILTKYTKDIFVKNLDTNSTFDKKLQTKMHPISN
jgi:poly-gamma-glutamate capsule biosynthesis protein CapA/YwtB (metallophosphatase superfamily)